MFENKDYLVLANLRQNARAKLTDISRNTSIPTSTLYDKIKIYESDIIRRFTLLLNFEALGFNTRVSMLVKCKNKEQFREFIIKHRAVNNVFRVNNGYDFLIEAVFKQIKHAEDFIEHIDKRFTIESKDVHYIIDDLKREGFLSSPMAFKLVGL